MYLLVVIPSQLIGQINEKACDPQPDAHKYGISHSVNSRIDLNQNANRCMLDHRGGRHLFI